jgi:RNA polymerase sigma-70 factor (sigma-E family)
MGDELAAAGSRWFDVGSPGGTNWGSRVSYVVVAVVDVSGCVVAVDASGFAEFVAARYGALVRSGYLLVGDRGLAEDLVQSALYRTFVAWGRLRAEQAAESYTRVTMVRLAGRWSRRRWRGEISEPDGFDESRVEVDRAGDVGVGIDVRRALAGLPWSQRAVLVLRYFDDLSEAQTAQVLGCSVGTVKSRASRGLAALRTAGLVQPSAADGEVHRG